MNRLFIIIAAVWVMFFSAVQHAASAAPPLPRPWLPDCAVRRQVQDIVPTNVDKIEFFGQMLLGSSSGSIEVSDKTLIAAFVKALKDAELPRPEVQKTPTPRPGPAVPNAPTADGDYSFEPASAAGINLYVRTAPNSPSRMLTFPFVPGVPGKSYGPEFVAATRLLSGYYASIIRATIQREAPDIVAIHWQPVGIDDEGEPPVFTDKTHVQSILIALRSVDERAFAAAQLADTQQRSLAPGVTLERKDGKMIPIYLVIAVPDDISTAPPWLRTFYDECSK